MKILIATHSLIYGGSPVSAFQLARELKRRGHEILILAPENGPMRERFSEAEIDVEILPELFSGRFSHAAWFLMDSGEFDVLLAFTAFSRHVVKWAKELTDVPVVWAIRGDVTRQHEKLGVTRNHFKMADAVTFVSEATAAQHADWVQRDNWSVIPNGIDLAECDEVLAKVTKQEARQILGIPNANSSFVLLNVGRFVPGKRQLDFLAAAWKYGKKDTVFCLAGGPHLAESTDYPTLLRDGVTDLNRQGITTMFLQERPEALLFYRAADVLVHCSEAEGSPRAILEAMAMGVPVIAADIPAVHNIEGCTLYSLGGIEKIVSLIDYHREMQSEDLIYLTPSGGEFVRRHHDIRTVAQQYEKLFERIVR